MTVVSLDPFQTIVNVGWGAACDLLLLRVRASNEDDLMVSAQGVIESPSLFSVDALPSGLSETNPIPSDPTLTNSERIRTLDSWTYGVRFGSFPGAQPRYENYIWFNLTHMKKAHGLIAPLLFDITLDWASFGGGFANSMSVNWQLYKGATDWDIGFDERFGYQAEVTTTDTGGFIDGGTLPDDSLTEDGVDPIVYHQENSITVTLDGPSAVIT